MLDPSTHVLLFGADSTLIYLLISCVLHDPMKCALIQIFSFGVNNIHLLRFHETFDARLALPNTPPKVPDQVGHGSFEWGSRSEHREQRGRDTEHDDQPTEKGHVNGDGVVQVPQPINQTDREAQDGGVQEHGKGCDESIDVPSLETVVTLGTTTIRITGYVMAVCGLGILTYCRNRHALKSVSRLLGTTKST